MIKRVQIRKPRICQICQREFPPGSQLILLSGWIHGSGVIPFKKYFCLECAGDEMLGYP